jgi:hypothetical protein
MTLATVVRCRSQFSVICGTVLSVSANHSVRFVPGRETAAICSEETGFIPARFFQEGDFGDDTAAVPQ